MELRPDRPAGLSARPTTDGRGAGAAVLPAQQPAAAARLPLLRRWCTPASACWRPTSSPWSRCSWCGSCISDRVIYGVRPRRRHPGPRSPRSSRSACWWTRPPTAARVDRRRRASASATSVPLRRRRHGHHRLADPAARAGVLPAPSGCRRRRGHRRPGRRRRHAAARAARAVDDPVRRPERRCATRSTWAGSARTSASTSADRSRSTVGPLLARSPHVRLHEHRRGAAAVRAGRPAAGCCCTRPASSSTASGSCCRRCTDTGKTGTILRLLREHGGRFLSDDMTIIDADGPALVLPEAADDQPPHAAGGAGRRPDARGSGAGCGCRAGCTPRRAARWRWCWPATTCRSWRSTRSPRSSSRRRSTTSTGWCRAGRQSSTSVRGALPDRARAPTPSATSRPRRRSTS